MSTAVSTARAAAMASSIDSSRWQRRQSDGIWGMCGASRCQEALELKLIGTPP